MPKPDLIAVLADILSEIERAPNCHRFTSAAILAQALTHPNVRAHILLVVRHLLNQPKRRARG